MEVVGEIVGGRLARVAIEYCKVVEIMALGVLDRGVAEPVFLVRPGADDTAHPDGGLEIEAEGPVGVRAEGMHALIPVV